MKNKIVHVGWYNSNPIGGVGKTILEQTRALARLGVDVEIWDLGTDCSVPTMMDVGEAYPVWKLPVKSILLGQGVRFPRVTKEWVEARRGEVKALHLHSVFVAKNCLISRIGIPYLITPNGGWSEEVLVGRNAFLKRIWIRVFERPLWKGAAAVQAVSRREAEQLASLPDMGPVAYIPNGTDVPESVPAYQTRSTILFMGRYGISQKGLDVLIEALASIRHKLPGNFRLVMAGADYRGGRSEVESMICAAKLSDFIETHGPVFGREKQALFENAKLFIHTSRWEGLPLVLLEALAYGIPCLLTPGTNVDREWENAGCAFSVPLEPDQIGEKILDLWPRDLSIESENARSHVTTEFSWDGIAARLVQEYDKC